VFVYINTINVNCRDISRLVFQNFVPDSWFIKSYAETRHTNMFPPNEYTSAYTVTISTDPFSIQPGNTE